MQLTSTQAALRFCASSTAAVVLTVWPSGAGELATVRGWLEQTSSRVIHEQPVTLENELAELLVVMALYDGEEWLESNCWYMEQPLPTGPPAGPYAGAKWKRALCFRGERRDPHLFVLDTTGCTASLWSTKYRVRSQLARDSGNPGNSCIHLTDEQPAAVLAQRRSAPSAGGMSCDESYAFSCARALLHPASLAWLNGAEERERCAGGELKLGSSAEFRAQWARYARWLAEPSPDCTDEGAWVQPPF